ncbi:uncharacterized protein LOC128238888 [Mya arenaria]|uniref:uncharacterized protein LOC128238888 n=1 Tax=Mya arenaria TaxID=6604 RepID=UPI0022E0A33D|nr:uncharacterized protein LOC128238888 [Mya arenaria]XP_052811157.1 uncharacterized protein LOC128238888 [Mya arenaria]
MVCACPTSADDMVIISNVKRGLDDLLDVCFHHAGKERYYYNPSKCKVLVFNENKKSPRTWKLGDYLINESDSYNHLGILCNKQLNINENISESCHKLRKTFFSVTNCGIGKNGLNPITSIRIYETKVLSAALYGSELWSGVTSNQLLPLERIHRQCIKWIQGVPKESRTDIALSCLGIQPIQNFIDSKKLAFLCQLCHADPNMKIKKVFVNRLLSFISQPIKAQGFIPDIYSILGKYELTSYLTEFSKSSVFPNKFVWKRICKSAIDEHVTKSWKSRVHNDENLKLFSLFHSNYEFCLIWRFLKSFPVYKKQCFSMFGLLCKFFARKYFITCYHCNAVTNEIVLHKVFFCPYFENERCRLWSKLINLLGEEHFRRLILLNLNHQLVEMLRGFTNLDITDECRIQCFIVVSNFAKNIN